MPEDDSPHIFLVKAGKGEGKTKIIVTDSLLESTKVLSQHLENLSLPDAQDPELSESLLKKRSDIFSQKIRTLAEEVVDEAVAEKSAQKRYTLLSSLSIICHVASDRDELWD